MRKWALVLSLGILLISISGARAQDDSPPYFGPLPLPTVEAITVDNATRLERIATIGTGEFRPGAVWSPDGAWLAVPSSAGTWLYETAHWDKNPILLPSAIAGIKTVIYNRDGQLLYAGDQHGGIQIWDTTAQVQLLTLQTGFKEVTHLALSPDGSRLAAGSSYGGLILWQGDDHLPGDGAFQFQIVASQEMRVGQLHFSPDGARLFAGGDINGYVDAISGERVRGTQSIPSVTRVKFKSSLKFSTDDRLFAGMVDDGLQIWDYSAGVQLQTLSIAHLSDYSSDFAFINNGAQILVSIPREGVQLWDVSSGQKVRDLPSDSRYVTDITVSPSGDSTLYETANGLEVWSLKTDTALMLQRSNETRVSSGGLTFSPTNLLVYNNAGYSRGLWLADLDQNHFERLEENFGGSGIAFSPGGDWLLTGGYTLRLWYLPQRVLDGAYPHERNGAVAFNPDGQTYVSGGSVIRVWDFESRTLKQAVGESFGSATDLSFNSDGTRLASVHFADRKRGEKPSWSVVMWDSTTYQPLWTLDNRTDPLAFQPGGQRLLVHECVTANNNGGCDQKIAHLVDAASGETVYTIPYEINSPAFSADGSLLVGGTIDGALVLWDVNNGSEIGRWQVDRFESRLYVAFSPDGRYIVTMSSASSELYGSGVGSVWGVTAGDSDG